MPCVAAEHQNGFGTKVKKEASRRDGPGHGLLLQCRRDMLFRAPLRNPVPPLHPDPNEGGILMARAEKAERREEDAASSERVTGRIRQHVLAALGSPSIAHEVHVRPLWANYFRVNVLLGESLTCLTVAHSFFLQADSEGRVLESSPELVQRYGPLC
jgi:hypothetical protein